MAHLARKIVKECTQQKNFKKQVFFIKAWLQIDPFLIAIFCYCFSDANSEDAKIFKSLLGLFNLIALLKCACM